jgi:hypothetical protein
VRQAPWFLFVINALTRIGKTQDTLFRRLGIGAANAAADIGFETWFASVDIKARRDTHSNAFTLAAALEPASLDDTPVDSCSLLFAGADARENAIVNGFVVPQLQMLTAELISGINSEFSMRRYRTAIISKAVRANGENPSGTGTLCRADFNCRFF